MTKSPELKQRKAPAQKRAEQTVSHILDTSVKLLEEVGFDGFNTNLLAERADLRIGTIYRYFPNKFAILTALVQRWIDQLEETLGLFGGLADTERDWRDVIMGMIEAYLSMIREKAGFIAIRRAMQATPELRAMETKLVFKMTDLLVEALKTRGVEIPEKRLINIAATVIMAGSGVLDLAWIRGSKNKTFDPEIIEELKVLLDSYLCNYLEQGSGRS